MNSASYEIFSTFTPNCSRFNSISTGLLDDWQNLSKWMKNAKKLMEMWIFCTGLCVSIYFIITSADGP